MRRFIWVLALLPGLALAESEEGAEILTGAQIEAALTDRALRYTDGASQRFSASGDTMYEAGRPSWGRWAVRGDHYCSQWPPSGFWACYTMQRDGETFRFVGEDGSVTEGVYLNE